LLLTLKWQWPPGFNEKLFVKVNEGFVTDENAAVTFLSVFFTTFEAGGNINAVANDTVLQAVFAA
jgi:hypothetical protein